jgi:hypothetical protein
MRFVILAAILSVLAIPAFAQSSRGGDGKGPQFGSGDGGGRGGGRGGGKPHVVHPAPIPLAGAGLPALGLVLGAGAYSLVRATRKHKNRE